MSRIPDWRDNFATLPEHLGERYRPLNEKAIEIHGQFVLYWMHHALRGHENPALDVATALGNRIGVPVLVYQGLGGSHGYDNDRHHSLIMQGARDAHRELQERGIRAIFNSDREGDQPSPLRQLVARAAALVVEEFPAPPFPRWTVRLARHSPVAGIAVDCSCIVPMKAQPKRFTRAFDFRRHNQQELERRLPLPWTDVEPTQPAFSGELCLDLERYRRRVTHQSTDHTMRIAVIGTGISGLAAARTLQDQGHRVTVFEKSRGSGGRAATRRINELQFDHGAQYFTARDPAFQRAVTAWRERGLVRTWSGRIGRVRSDRIEPEDDEQERFVGVPGMSAIGKHLAADLTVHTGVRVAPPLRLDGGWRLRSEVGETLGDFDLLIVAVPAPQAEAMLTPCAPDLAARAASVRYAPVWALMLAFDNDPGLPYDGLFFNGDEICWAARNSSKPGRSGNTWVVHAAPACTRARCDEPGEAIAAELSKRFASRAGIDSTDLVAQTAHLWRYSLVDNPLDLGAILDPALRLGVCGDWCQGARIEGAFLSGQAIAGRILGYLANVSASSFEASSAVRVAGTA